MKSKPIALASAIVHRRISYSGMCFCHERMHAFISAGKGSSLNQHKWILLGIMVLFIVHF